MPILVLPLLLIVVMLLAVVLIPVSLGQRYRHGRKRKRVIGWQTSLNAWGTLLSLPCFLAAAWLGTVWSADALRDAVFGLLVGALLGIAGLWLTRFEHAQPHHYYTPNRWLVLALTLLVAGRIMLGVVWTWRRASGAEVVDGTWTQLVHAGGLWAVGGLLLGYAAAYAWGLRRYLVRHARR